MEVIPGVYSISSLLIGRAYLVVEGRHATLIDTGLPRRTARILGTLHTLGLPPHAVRRVIVTHYHGDHAGGLAELAERTGAEVMVHASDAPVVRGDVLPPGRPAARWLRPLVVPPPAPVHRELVDGDELDCLGGLRVFHTPGHTAGSISLYSPRHRLLFVGDAAAHLFSVHPPLWSAVDLAQAKRSLQKLAGLDLDAVCFGHGSPLVGRATRHFHRLVEQR